MVPSILLTLKPWRSRVFFGQYAKLNLTFTKIQMGNLFWLFCLAPHQNLISYLTLEMGKGKFLQYDQIHFAFSATMQYIREFYEKLLFLVQINCRGISLILQRDVSFLFMTNGRRSKKGTFDNVGYI